MDGFSPEVVDLNKGFSADDLWVHDSKDRMKASLLTQMFDDPKEENSKPRPFGIFYEEDRFKYEEGFHKQIDDAIKQKGEGDLDQLLSGNYTWQIV